MDFLGGLALGLACALTGLLGGCIWALMILDRPRPPQGGLPEAAPVVRLRRAA